LYFEPGVYEADGSQSTEWNRGAYLVKGLGHCSACHASRNALGASHEKLDGSPMPVQGWYAPSLLSRREASVADWEPSRIVALLRDGVAPGASTIGPMAEVVYGSTQYYDDADLQALAAYLVTLPVVDDPAPEPAPVGRAHWARGERIYSEHCADCHGERGEGVRGMYPALAGNRAITMDNATNVVSAVLRGGFPP